MRSLRLLPWHPLVGLAAILAAIALAPPPARAGDERAPRKDASETTRGATCKEADASGPSGAAASLQPKLYEMRPVFDVRDEAAALEAVHVALSEVGDGSTYVWYRHGGRLSGLVQPTQSFKDVLGRVCRHLVVTLNDASRSRRTEGIACRLANGVWELDG